MSITKEHILQAKEDSLAGIGKAQETVAEIYDDLLSNFEEEKYAIIKKVYWDNGKIVVEYEANVDIDIHYGFGDKTFEVENNVKKIDDSGSFTIGIGKPEKNWWVQVVGEGVATDKVSVGPYNVPEPIEKYDFWNGLWDSWNYSGEGFNTTKTKGISDGIGIEGNVFVSLSHRWKGKTKDQWRSILRGFVSEIEKLDPARTIILLQDEPLSTHHGFTLEEVQFLYDTAKELMPEYQFGFTFTRGAVNNKDLPKADWIMLTAYPFFREDYPDIQVHGKDQFDKWFDAHIEKAREKFSGDIFVIGQGFYNPDSAPEKRRKWRRPPIEAPGWYAEAIIRNKLKGIIWWVYSIERDDTIGLEDIPEYFEKIKQISNT